MYPVEKVEAVEADAGILEYKQPRVETGWWHVVMKWKHVTKPVPYICRFHRWLKAMHSLPREVQRVKYKHVCRDCATVADRGFG